MRARASPKTGVNPDQAYSNNSNQGKKEHKKTAQNGGRKDNIKWHSARQKERRPPAPTKARATARGQTNKRPHRYYYSSSGQIFKKKGLFFMSNKIFEIFLCLLMRIIKLFLFLSSVFCRKIKYFFGLFLNRRTEAEIQKIKNFNIS